MKIFNIVGNCIPQENYMVDTSNKLNQIMKMIEQKDYFIINRPRQFGKTTTLFLLRTRLLDSKEYLPISTSFEGIGSTIFQDEAVFCAKFLRRIINNIIALDNTYRDLLDKLKQDIEPVNDFGSLSEALATVISNIDKKVVLFIDEVDKSGNYKLFINFLGMLRDKYLNTRAGLDVTFHSVILAGVNDIKTLKQKIRPEVQSQQNSPWNIAVPFEVDMSFNPSEIETMLVDYIRETGNKMDTKAISERIFFWSSGYPFLVSNLCKIVDEKILPASNSKAWDVQDIDQAAKILKSGTNTLFDVLIKNLENNSKLYNLVENIVLGNQDYAFRMKNPLTNIAFMYGFIDKNSDGRVRIHNKIFYEAIVEYLVSKVETDAIIETTYNEEKEYIKKNGRLDFDLVLTKFQKVIKEKYSKADVFKSKEFLESTMRILFLVYLDPIVNGQGFSFKEVEIGAEKRLDIVVTYLDERFVVELKVWRGEKLHEEGKQQLKRYMESMSINKGYMLIINKNQNKTFKREVEDGILMVHI